MLQLIKLQGLNTSVIENVRFVPKYWKMSQNEFEHVADRICNVNLKNRQVGQYRSEQFGENCALTPTDKLVYNI